jgi:hypothetical protein
MLEDFLLLKNFKNCQNVDSYLLVLPKALLKARHYVNFTVLILELTLVSYLGHICIKQHPFVLKTCVSKIM